MSAPRKDRRKTLLAELASVHDSAKAAWTRGQENRAKLARAKSAACPAVMGTLFDGDAYHSVQLEPAITVDTAPYERWMHEQTFPTTAEAVAYRTITETWLDAWLWVCRMRLGREYSRPLALEAAGVKPGRYERTARKRGGLAAREAAALDREIVEETTRLEVLQRDRRSLRALFPAVPWPKVTRRAAHVALLADSLGKGLVLELRRWHAAKKHPANRARWSRLIELREAHILACHAAIVAFHKRREFLAGIGDAAIPRP